MKKATLLFTFLSIGFAASAQTAPTKHLPAKVTIALTAQQIMRLDSAAQAINGNIDSKRTTEYILSSFSPIWLQVQKQMVVDTVKKVGGGK